LNRRVAIKVIAPNLALDPQMIERFRREATTAASLSHRNIVKIFAVEEADFGHYLVMEFIEGKPLDQVLKDLNVLPIAMVQAILFQVGGALAHAHGRGVVHRDIKPANIMLSVDGEAIVTDFGIAKVAESVNTTLTIGPIGTPIYMSPEQCRAA